MRRDGHYVGETATPGLAVMGVLNATPDSFSDGGLHLDPRVAARRGLAMARAGAAVIDVGGESTRPGAEPVDAETQRKRVVPVVRGLRDALDAAGLADVALGVDTRSADVADAALDAGATLVNDVSAGRDDPALLPLAARRGVRVVLMHMRGEPKTMQRDPRYGDVVAEVEGFLDDRVAAAVDAGIDRDRLLIDPGIGFGKSLEHNLALLAAVPRFVASGLPVLIGASRKRFIHALDPRTASSPTDRVAGSVAVTLWAAEAGAAMVRVHDVEAHAQALRVWSAIRSAPER